MQADICSILILLKKENIAIPVYQRPYRWKEKNVTKLLDDLFYFYNKKVTRYRLGTIIFHEDDSTRELFIVDGQQRIITLWLISYILHNLTSSEYFSNDFLNTLFTNSPKNQFSNETKENVRKNYLIINEYLNSNYLKGDLKLFYKWLMESCEVVTFTLDDISEAFQFFDSQNSRGKDLYPHDLLKAFHLRAFKPQSPERKRNYVMPWEKRSSADLADLFSIYLLSIKNWSQNKPTEVMTKGDIEHFKGLNVEELQAFPYAQIYLHIESLRDQTKECSIPYQIDQVMINGEYFFNFVKNYLQKIECLRNENINHYTDCKYYISLANNNEKNYRSGDQLVRYLFLSAYIYYYDKFGDKYIGKFTVFAFKWAYALRIINHRISLSAINKHVLTKNNNLFEIIRNSIKPEYIFNTELGYRDTLIKTCEKKKDFKNNDKRILKIFDL